MKSWLCSPVVPGESLVARQVGHLVLTFEIQPHALSGITYDISNKHRLGYSEVQLVQCMIDGVSWDGTRNPIKLDLAG